MPKPLSNPDQARINGAKPRSAPKALEPPRYAVPAIVLSNEDPAAFQDLVDHYVRRIQPADQVEYHLASQLAAIAWRLTRNHALETRLLDREMAVQLPSLDASGLSIPELTRLLNASQATVERSQYSNHLARREAQLISARNSTLSFLRDLRKNFPLCDPSPEIIPPQPLNPELPLQNEPERSGADPLVCAEPPGSAPCAEAGSNCPSTDSETAPLLSTVPPAPARAISAIVLRRDLSPKALLHQRLKGVNRRRIEPETNPIKVDPNAQAPFQMKPSERFSPGVKSSVRIVAN